MERYIDFELRIDEARRGFLAQASVEGLGEGHHEFSFSFEGRNWDGLLEAPLPAHREVLVQSERMSPRRLAEKVGRELFNVIFGGQVQGLWRRSLERASDQEWGVRLRLRLRDPVISNWPWEHLFDPDRNEFLALSAKTPVVRYLEMPVPVAPLRIVPPLRMLVAIAAPSGCQELDTKGEWSELRFALRDLERKGVVELDLLEEATCRNLRRKLQKTFHILHFIGHGVFDPTEQEGVLLFEGKDDGPERVTGSALAALMRESKALRMVVLNCCSGAREGPNPFAGVAQSLVRGGIPAVLAMRGAVADRAAITFASAFYQELAEGSLVEAALSEARKEMFVMYREGIEWGMPVLFTRSREGRIFEATEAPEPSLLRTVIQIGTDGRAMILSCLLLGGALLLGEWSMKDPGASSREPDVQSTPAPAPPPPLTKGCPASKTTEMPFVRIEPGRFLMGSKRWAKDERRHEVRISDPFCMGVYEVTQAEWEALMGPAPGKGARDPRLPVTWVSPVDVAHFIEALNEREPGAGYRLPTEAQWEYAARAGASTRFSFGDDPAELHLYGNCKSKEINDGYDGLAPVGQFRPNEWGLHDMHGNVSEWVQDWYGSYSTESVTDPQGSTTREKRLRRGGSFSIVPENCSAVRRTISEPEYRSDDVGFRLVRAPQSQG